jgi:hypothetical protein
VTDDLSAAEAWDAATAGQLLRPDAEAPTWTLTEAGPLTREGLQAAIDQIQEHRLPDPDSPEIRAEIALARWLDRQPPGTAEKLLRRWYGGEEMTEP